MTKKPRPKTLQGITYTVPTGCGKLYVACNDKDGSLFEVFIHMGKSGGCSSASMEALGRVISTGLRGGIDPGHYIKTLAGIQCHRSPSCVDAVAQAIKMHEEGRVK